MHCCKLARITWSWMFLLLSTVSSGACSEPDPEARNAKVRRDTMIDLVKSFDTSIDFYGRVLDQDDRPVEGAVVVVGIRHFSLVSTYFMGSKNIDVKTDQGGFFEISGHRGSDVFIGGISREGYEYMLSQNPVNSFDYGGSNEPAFVPDKNDPVIFRMRKKLKNRTLMFEKPRSGIQVLLKESGLLKGTDFIEGKRTRRPEDKVKDSLSEKCDLWYQATYDEETGEWNVVLKPGGPNGGILVNDQKLFVGPEDGYQQEWSFVPESRKNPKTNFVYLKSRSPAIFSRLEIFSVVVTDGFVRIRWKVTTNPYGDRVLDSVDFPPYSTKPEIERIYQVGDRLEEEAKAALREGRLPPRPKIMALIEAAKRGEE